MPLAPIWLVISSEPRRVPDGIAIGLANYEITSNVLPTARSAARAGLPGALRRHKIAAMTRLLAACLGLGLLLAPASTPPQAPMQRILENRAVRAVFAGDRLTSLTEVASGAAVRLDRETFGVTVNGAALDPASVPAPTVQADTQFLSFTYRFPAMAVTTVYDLDADWGFLTKRVRIEPTDPATAFRINDIRTLTATMAPVPGDVLPLSEGRFGMIFRLFTGGGSGPGASVLMLHQNPYNVFAFDGARITASYTPEMSWNASYGAFESDRLILQVVPRSGRVMPARSVPEWVHVSSYDGYLRETPAIDDAESAALVDSVRAFLLYRPSKSIRVHVPWTENDYQIDVATPDGWTEYQRILDAAAAVGAQSTLFTGSNSSLSRLADNKDAWNWENLLFFAMGQKIRTGEWVPGRDPVPASLKTMIDAGAARGLKYMAYAYPTLPFLQDPAWTRWAGAKVGGNRGADTGERGFQDWWVKTLVDFVRTTGAAGFSFDHWWIAYDDPAATSRYAQWFGARRILEELRRRVPDIVVDGRQQYMNFGPWTWLAGSYPHPTLTDEQPESFQAFPDLHTDRVSANRQRFAAWKYRVERFAPPEIMPGYFTHQTERSDAKDVMRRDRFRPRDWDVLGWKYSLISSIGTAPFNHTISYLPARDEAEFKAFGAADKSFIRRWFDWTDAQAETLRHLKPIIGPPMIGRVDGTAAISNGRGFVFLFNPNYRAMDAVFGLDASIGLTGAAGSSFVLRELHPEEGRRIGKPGAGFYGLGDEVRIAMRANEAMVIEVSPAPSASSDGAMVFNVSGRASLSAGTLALNGVEGEPGTTRTAQIILPAGRTVSRVTVNGASVAFKQSDRLIEANIAFAGTAFGRSRSVFAYDPAFAGGRLSSTFVVPGRVFAQLRARRAAWPVPYTDDDLRAPWLGSDRLLLFVQVAEPDDRLIANDSSTPFALSIDGNPIALVRAYNSIYGHSPRRTFLGLYADVSTLAPEVAHRVELTVPPLPAGRFQGLFFENVEPEMTRAIRSALRGK